MNAGSLSLILGEYPNRDVCVTSLSGARAYDVLGVEVDHGDMVTLRIRETPTSPTIALSEPEEDERCLAELETKSGHALRCVVSGMHATHSFRV